MGTLCVTRKDGQAIRIGESITIRVHRIGLRRSDLW